MTRHLGGYLLQEKIYESANSEVYRGVHEVNCQRCILKILKQDYPTYRELTRYKQEYQIIRNLNLDGVIKAYGLEPNHKTLVIILEDFGASSLQQLMQKSERFASMASEELLFFLKIAISIADAVGQLHGAQVIHKDISPANIVLNPQTNQVKLIDFGISTVLTQENPGLKYPHVLEGTLPYISPEQTGRMNRPVDYRTDFYSLGATFYELLSGQPPFVTNNAMELVHCHIAKQPHPLDQVLAQQNRIILPPTISKIVMKLLAKTAEERYQSAWGLKADLEECYQQLEATGNIGDFLMGQHDVSDKFKIPQKLYDRDPEIETLLAAFERIVSQRKAPTLEMMLVTGQPGIGKSALVQEIHKPITAKHGYFISGKFDQFQHNIPYSALVEALRGLIQQLLTESAEQLGQWRRQLLSALQPNAQILVDVIPELALIIGQQPSCETLGAIETQNRFHRVFRQFIQVFCQPEHPLVIFLDDLQWIDSATLKLIEVIVTGHDLAHLFLIGAYRDNEVSATHPLSMTLVKLRQQQATIHQINLTALHLNQVNQLVSKTLKNNPARTFPLAQLITRKTHGNPFFIKQLLKTLHHEQLITFDIEALRWQWDLTQIEQRDITANVVDFMIENINQLPPNTQAQLRLAACLGANFDLKTLTIVSKRSSSTVAQTLLPAVQVGLILPMSAPDAELLIQDYKFSHDRIQQAAHSAIDLPTLKAMHLQIGQLLQANLSKLEKTERIFEIVDHLNLGQELLNNAQERSQLAEFNLAAGQKAKESTAYAAALQYLIVGTQLLTEQSWDEAYSLAFELHKELAEVCYLEGDLEQAQQLIALLLEKSQSIVDQAAAYSLSILIHTLQAEYAEAIQVGRIALQLFNIIIPTDNLPKHWSHELQQAHNYWQDRDIVALAHEPEMQIPEQISAIQLLMQLLVPAYLTDQDLFTFLAARSANLSFCHGPTPESTLGYSCYGTVLSRSGDYQSGYEFALMALELTKRFGDLKNRAKACNLLADHAAHWVRPLAEVAPLHDEGYEAALISGDLQFAGYLIHGKVLHAFASGQNLEEILTQCDNHLAFAQETQNFLATNTLLAYRFAILNLLGRTDTRSAFHDAEIQESAYIENMHSRSDYFSSCFFHILRLQISYLYGDFAIALDCADQAKQFLPAIRNFFQESELTFYESLSLIGQTNIDQQQQHRTQLDENLAQLEIWSNYCPENFLHKHLLVKAELARLDHHGMEAVTLYDCAITSAAESGFIQAEALGHELAAKFWLGHNKPEFATLHLQKARHGYQLWGASRKVTHLEKNYSQFFESQTAEASSLLVTTTVIADSEQVSKTLDLESILKASQALSGAILLEELLVRLMKLTLENAGAQHGSLLLEKEGKWFIEASANLDHPEVQVLRSLPIEHEESHKPILLPISIIQYVARSQKDLVLDNAITAKHYAQDPYVIEHQIRSVICIPLLFQGQLTGILYLENNLLDGAFTADRIAVLKLLSSQAAISLKNAQLYTSLRDSERNLAQFNQELANKNIDLEKVKNDLATYSQTLEQKVAERTAALTETNQQLQQQIKEREHTEQKLQLANQELEKLAVIDGLTQIANRRYFDQWLEQEWNKLKDEKKPLSLILFDVDYFKNYNDYYSHQAGDDCLIAIAQAAKATMRRPSDLVARYGGEEFAVILPDTTRIGASEIAQQIQNTIRELAIPHVRSHVSEIVSVSLGIATMIPTAESSPKELIAWADQALYNAKQQGRDRYAIHM